MAFDWAAGLERASASRAVEEQIVAPEPSTSSVAHVDLDASGGHGADVRVEAAQAAVASILRETRDGVDLLFIERADRPGDPWSGHLAFPGGRREARDRSLYETAVRETREEVGLSLGRAHLVTRLDDVVARVNGFRVAQFVFALEDFALPLAPNAEVAATLWVPLDVLATADPSVTFTYRRDGHTIEAPCVHLDGRVLWGMTYTMVYQLIGALTAAGR